MPALTKKAEPRKKEAQAAAEAAALVRGDTRPPSLFETGPNIAATKLWETVLTFDYHDFLSKDPQAMLDVMGEPWAEAVRELMPRVVA